MTSVQNHQRLLNGNNFLIFLMIICGITSCAAKKVTATKRTEIVAINKNSTLSSKEVAEAKKRYEDSIARKAQALDIDNSDVKGSKDNSKSKDYNDKSKALNEDINRIRKVAVILPFNLNQIPLGNYVDDSTKQLSVESRNAVEFYLGCLMAKDKFQSSKLKSNVYFIDEPKDTDEFASIFNNKPFPDIDYIVAPVTPSNLNQFANLAKSNKIPLISPFTSSIYIKDNNYLFNANPSLLSQYSYILDNIKSRFPSKIVEVIYDGKDSSAENIKFLKDILDEKKMNGNVKYFPLASSDDIASAMLQTDTLSERIVLIYSSKEIYIKSAIAKLKHTKNDLQIFTSSCVRYTKALADAKYPHSIYTIYAQEQDNVNYKILASQFEEKYMKPPTEIAFKAYDIMMNLFSVLDKNQNLIDNTYNYSTNFDTIHSKFKYEPVYNQKGRIDYYDNQVMYLYKYVNGNFVLNSNN